MTCYRYIDLNPVRANRVHHPRDYRWSSYRAHAEARQDSILTSHSLYMGRGQNEVQGETAYRGLFGVDLDPGQIAATGMQRTEIMYLERVDLRRK
jgi:putative transposase